MPLSAGARVGPYEIVAPLGVGGMGEVYRARDQRLRRDVAIKALPPSFALDPDRLARFEREARLLASLKHPNIAAIYGLEDVSGTPHLVLELVEGETLGQRLSRGALDSRSALRIAVQIASAIETAHERGIVHRDLKPGNIMLEPGGTAKVLDFGLAKDDADGPTPAVSSQLPTMPGQVGSTVPGAVLGTAAYMSPEQARGLPVDRRSDVWSFGCILFESLTGRPPFEGATITDLLARILEREPNWRSLPAGLSPRVQEIIKRCLRKNADERPRDIRDVRLDLAEAAAGDGRREAGPERSIVVLPFTHAGGSDDEYFADGITEEILNSLTHLEDLRVAARTSSFAFKGRSEDLRQIAEKLNVSTVLEGSVRRSGNRLRITAQLVDAADGYQMWSERYDRELTDVFEVQDEIASAIAAKLKVTLARRVERGSARGTSNLEAYELFLKGRAILYRRGRYILEALGYFEEAIALDPGYAEALAWMSECHRLMATFSMAPTREAMPKAKEAATRALGIDPENAEAHATLADVEAQYERDFPRAMASWQRVLDIDPRHTRARCERALWSAGFGGMGLDEAVNEVELAILDDPVNAWAISMQSMLLGLSGRFAEGLAAAHRAVEADPSNFFAHWNLARSYLWAGEYEKAIAMGPALLASSGRQVWLIVVLTWAHAGFGNASISRALYDELDARSRSEYVSRAWQSAAAIAVGRLDEAMGLARRAVEDRDAFVLLTRHFWFFEPLWNRPDFQELLDRIGFVGPARK